MFIFGGVPFASNINLRASVRSAGGAGAAGKTPSGARPTSQASSLVSVPSTASPAGAFPRGGTTPSGARVTLGGSSIGSPPGIGQTPSSTRIFPSRSTIRYAGAEASVGGARVSPAELSDEWVYGLRYGQRFVLTLTEAIVRRAWPVAPVAEDLMYFLDDVEVTGTEASPETFTTNVGKLAVMSTGAPWPTFNASTHKFSVHPHGKQDARISLVNTPSVSGGNLTFQLAISDYGNPKPSDSKFYARITIFLQAI